jgi:inner membrane transporter RhtA
MAIGAIVTLPFGLGTAGSALFTPVVLLLGLAVAMLSSAIPYALELLALRRLAAASFSILMSLAPAIAALAGALVLGQGLTLISSIAILLVVVASAGAVRSASLHAKKQAALAEPVF